METKHTPGPWKIVAGLNYTEADLVAMVQSRRSPLAIIATDQDVTCNNSEADAQLIAAAPDLLEALRGVLACGFGEFEDCGPPYEGWPSDRQVKAADKARRPRQGATVNRARAALAAALVYVGIALALLAAVLA